ncbi:MAG: hypothetical protein ACKVPX_05030 [Myxococcaceae bacterium]
MADLLGALTGAVVASWVWPNYLAWNNTPGVGQALCDCVQVTRDTASQLIRAQAIGAVAGALLFSFFAVVFFRREKPAQAPAPAAPPPPQ